MTTPAKPKPCWCGEYAFPHRLFGGRCEGDGAGNPMPWDMKGEVPGDWDNINWERENRLNDPRRGEAAEINAANRRFRGEV